VVVEDPQPAIVGDHRPPPTTLASWRAFVDEDPLTFTLADQAMVGAFDEHTRMRYDEERIRYHSELVLVATSTVRDVIRQGRLLTMLNQREISARRGLIVSGAWATGKSTAIKQLGRTHELLVRRRYPGDHRIPVVYVTTPPKGSPRKLAAEFARFLGLPTVKSRYNVTDIADSVCQVLIDARTDLVIDELHNLNTATRAGAEASDTLKYFSERIPATFCYAGISLERTGLLSGTRGEQIAGRFGMVRTGPFGQDPQWTALIAALEDSLRLHRHRPGTLTKLDRYLHQRTHGMIGSLLWLIRSAAINAVLDGTDTITKKSLDVVEADITAQSPRPPAA
jgi:hypothetical protein